MINYYVFLQIDHKLFINFWLFSFAWVNVLQQLARSLLGIKYTFSTLNYGYSNFCIWHLVQNVGHKNSLINKGYFLWRLEGNGILSLKHLSLTRKKSNEVFEKHVCLFLGSSFDGCNWRFKVVSQIPTWTRPCLLTMCCILSTY